MKSGIIRIRLPYMRPIVATDIDEVLVPFLESGFFPWYNARNGTDYRREDVTRSYRLHENLGNTGEYWVGQMRLFFLDGGLRRLGVMDNAQEMVAQLARIADVHAVTARPVEWHEDTMTHMNEHFPQVQDTHSLEAYLAHGKKAQKCLELDARVMIEDSKDYARECVEAGVQVILMDAPWNQGALPSGVYRVYSWREIPALVRRLL